MTGGEPNAASVALIRDGKVLLIRRARAPLMGLWTLPGGRREAGEAIADTARREVLEELGVELIVLRPLTSLAAGGWTLAVFAADFASGTPVPSVEVADWRWVGLDDLQALETSPGLADVLAAALRPALPLA